MATLAERLNSWFADAAVPDSVGRLREPSTSEVAKAIAEDPSHEVSVSRSYLTALRNGSQTNPTVSVLSAIVKYFQSRDMTVPVSLSALVDEVPPADSSGNHDSWARTMSDNQVRSIALRAGKFTPELREQLLAIMDALGESSKNEDQDPS
ncbi:hypothetical protein GCM10027570_14080 [Streptomonospora sediminis]